MGKLVQVAKTVASGTPTTIQVTGIDSDDVYLVTARGLIPSSDDRLAIRVTKSGTIQTDSNYDNARRGMPVASAFQNNSDTNDSKIMLGTTESTGDGAFGVLYLFNFANSSEYSFITFETQMYASTPQLFGEMGGGVHTVASASDGLSFFYNTGSTFNNGAEIVLYKVI